ncbi:MAG: triose-phosphate isomerase [Anaerolineae bacterium]|nr:triose-phosphate isomerase [Anaerolineae bacterium]
MRKPFVAGNWKMNKTVEQAKALVAEILPGIQSIDSVERVFCPPATSLPTLSELLKDSGVGLGAQNMHWEASGAYTGELSAGMVKEFCQYVILGHSERRAYFAETDGTVNKKTKAALAAGLTPIVCVGETLDENKANLTAEVIKRQIHQGLAEMSPEQASKIVVAYEPVWAIGTGLAATAPEANTVIKSYIRDTMKEMFGAGVAEGVRILYGGSVTAANAAEFFSQPDIDGALVGGACSKPDFIQIVKAAAA